MHEEKEVSNTNANSAIGHCLSNEILAGSSGFTVIWKVLLQLLRGRHIMILKCNERQV